MYRTRFASALAMAALAAILLPSSLRAQITFQRTYGGALWDGGGSVRQTTGGGYIITGSTKSFGAGDADVYLVETDSLGDTLWSKAFGGTDVDYGCEVQQTADSGYVVAGVTFSFGAGMGDVWLIKTDADGDTLWTRTFGDTNPQWGYSVQQTADGGYIVVGNTGPYGGFDVYLIKTDARGDTLWTRTFGGVSDDRGSSVRQTADSGYIITGYNSSSDGAYLIKTTADGDAEWTRTYGGTDFDEGQSVQQTRDGGYVIAGDTRSFGAGGSDVYLVKTYADGDTQWTRTFGGTAEEWGYLIQQTTDNGYIVAAYTASFGAGDYDVYLIRTDSSGDSLWTRTFGGTAEDGCSSARQTADGGYIVAGGTYSFGAGGGDVYLVKTDSLGNVAVEEPKTSSTRASAFSVYCEPNPFRTRTAISLQLTAHSPAALAIFAASGRRVRTFTVNGSPYTVWSGDDDFGHALPSGTYFVRLAAGDQHTSARIVMQR